MNARATVCVFDYLGVTGATHMALVSEALSGFAYTPMRQGNDALIPRARSRAASAFLSLPREQMGDVFLMVDHDISWPHGDLEYLCAQAEQTGSVVAGIYPKRAFGKGFPVVFTDDAEGDVRIGDDSLLPARYVSSGFMAIPRAVLQEMAERLPQITDDETYWPFFMTIIAEEEGKNVWLSEDWAFCERARGAGFRVWAALKPRLEHTGPYTYRMVDAKTLPPSNEDVRINLTPKPKKVDLIVPGRERRW